MSALIPSIELHKLGRFWISCVKMERMKLLTLEATESTPEITFDPECGKLVIRGRSIPENATHFYYPILDWLNEYVEHPHDVTQLDLYLEYLNSISHKMLIEIFNRAQRLHDDNQKIQVNWFYDQDDDQMLEEGQVWSRKYAFDMQFQAVN